MSMLAVLISDIDNNYMHWVLLVVDTDTIPDINDTDTDLNDIDTS